MVGKIDIKSWFAYAVVLATLCGCSGKKDDPSEQVLPEESALKKEDVMTDLNRNPYQIAEWYAVSENDTTFLNEDPRYGMIMKQVFLLFIDGKYVNYYYGTGEANKEFLGKAEIFTLNLYYLRPFGFYFHWDEEESTMHITWRNSSDNWHLFPDNVTMKLDKKGYRRLKTYTEALATRTTGLMRFHYTHEGKEYTFVLKQMWNYAGDATPRFAKYVVF